MNPEIIPQLENIVNEVTALEEEGKQLSLRVKKMNEEILELRNHRDSLQEKKKQGVERLKEIAIFLENIAKEDAQRQHTE